MTSAIRILLDPELNLSAQEVATTWNSDPTLGTTVQLVPAPDDPTSFDPALGELALMVLGSVGLNVLSSALYDSIKMMLNRRNNNRLPPDTAALPASQPAVALPPPPDETAPAIKIRTITQPDGSVLLIVESL
jgi:hypothetical protein